MKRASALGRRMRRTYELYLFLIPAVAFYALFKYWPIYGLKIAFQEFSPFLGFSDSPYVGLDNFRRFFNSPYWSIVLRNTLTINLSSLLVCFPAPIILALLLNQVRSRAYKKSVQMITYAPYFISNVVLVGMMYTLFSPSTGIVNFLLSQIGVSPIFFMGRADLFVPMFVGSGVWQGMGWSAVVYLAALAGVSPELHESALIDGANRFQRIWHIDIPSIMPTIITMLLLQVGSLLTVGFDKAWLMQNQMTLSTGEVISTFTYKRGLIDGDFSYATAVGLMESALNFAMLVTFNRITKRATGSSLW